jgi:hypothetical protein
MRSDPVRAHIADVSVPRPAAMASGRAGCRGWVQANFTGFVHRCAQPPPWVLYIYGAGKMGVLGMVGELMIADR